MNKSFISEGERTPAPMDYQFIDRIMTRCERAAFMSALIKVIALPSMEKLTIEERMEILNLYKK